MSVSISVTGYGAVSPAGWGATALLAALQTNKRFEPTILERGCGAGVVRTSVLRVPTADATIPRVPRLRRASAISKFAAAAVVEALGPERLAAAAAGNFQVGVVFSLTNGCVNYSNRFFTEVLADPALASPILFPETVFNAPSSHLSAMLGSAAPNDTLIGDSAGFFTCLDLATEWICRGEVDACLVVAAEEIDWLSAEGLHLYSDGYLPSEGAAAVLLEPTNGSVKLLRLPDPVPFTRATRNQAAQLVRERLAATDDPQTLLVDGRAGVARYDCPETNAWADWTGLRWSPRTIVGESMGAATALQTVAAAAAIDAGLCEKAIVTATGANQQAGGLVLGR